MKRSDAIWRATRKAPQMNWTPETGADSDARIQDAMSTLESLVDRAGLANVVECLAVVCEDKCEHIRASWQDTRTANVWAVASRAFDSVAVRIKKLGL